MTVLAFLPHSNYWWGFDALRFYPVPVRLAWAMLALAGLAIAWRVGTRVTLSAPGVPPAALGLAAAVVSGVAFHLFRDRTGLIGRGTDIIVALRQGRPPAPESFFYNRLEPALAQWLKGVRSTPTLDEAGQLSVWIGAAAIGLAVWLLSRRAAKGTGGSAALIAGALVLFQGSTLIFFGHVEAWAFPAAALVIFFLAAQACREDGGPLWPAALAAALVMASHPLGWMVAPAFLALLAVRYRSGIRFRAGADVAALLIFAAGAVSLLLNRGTFAELNARLSPGAAFDALNTLWLLSAPAIVTLAVLIATADGRKALRSPALLPAAVAFVLFAAARLFLTTPLGGARDWDFFTPAGIALTAVAAAALAAAARQSGSRAVTGPVQVAVVSLFFLAPWIGVQGNADRATARHLAMVEATPSLPPRTAAAYHGAMGERFVYLGKARLAAAAYERAYVTWPDPRYSWRSGLCYLNAGLLEKAAEAFNETARKSPLDWQARSELGNVLCGLNQLGKSENVLREAILLNASAPEPRIHLARTLAQEGRNREAREMLESARPLLHPDDPAQGQFRLLDSQLFRIMVGG